MIVESLGRNSLREFQKLKNKLSETACFLGASPCPVVMMIYLIVVAIA